MNKQQIQQRVLQNGKPLDLNKFKWNEKTRTFSTNENNLVIDFSSERYSDFPVNLTIYAGDNSTIQAGTGSTIYAGVNSIIWAEIYSTINAQSYSTIHAEVNSTINAKDNSKIFSSGHSIISAGDNSIIFFKNTGVTVSAKGEQIKIVSYFEHIYQKKDDIIEIYPKKDDIIEIYPSFFFSCKKGHLVNGIHSITGKKLIYADEILSEIISKKGNVYKVINDGETKQSFLIEKEINGKKYYFHGATLKKAMEGLIFKISGFKREVNFKEAIMLYRDITGACSGGAKYFVNRNIDKKKDKYSIVELVELIEITKNQYRNDETFKNFFNKNTLLKNALSKLAHFFNKK